MADYFNSGTIMHLTLHDCTVINRGTIMHLDGENNQVENKGSIMHNDGDRVILMGSGINQQPQVKEKIVYKDRIVYRDRVIYRDRPSQKNCNSNRVRELENKVEELKAMLKKSSDFNKVQRLENKVCYYETTNSELKAEIKYLKEELDSTDRQKLLSKVERLKDDLERSRNRERTSRHQQYELGYQAGVVDGSNKKKEVFDWGVRPTKEQAEALMKQFLIWLDCEE